MYITSLKIENIRSIEEVIIDFNKMGCSTILTGNNGSGKSTILRSIAMGIVDEDSAASVLRELPGELVRKGCESGIITVNLTQGNGRKFRIRTEIKSQTLFEKVFQRVFKCQSS